MDNYLLDYETLGGFVDEIMKAKPMPAHTPEELNALREKNIKQLDDKICANLFGKLTVDQDAKLNQLFDSDESDPAVFENFFRENGIDLEKSIADSVKEFGAELLGGQNAQ